MIPLRPDAGPHNVRTIAPIQVTIGMPAPWTHLFEVTMSFSGVGHDELDLVMPVWTPGSYLVREFARNVQDFSAAGVDGKTLSWRKITKNRWRVCTKGAPTVVIKYSVYAFEISVRNSFLDDSHGFISGAGLFMFVDGFLDSPYEIQLNSYHSWHCIATGLDPMEGEPGRFRAGDFDQLVDSPIEIGNQEIFGFKLGDIPHYISLYGEGNCDIAQMAADLQKIAAAASEVVGEIPYRHYTFLIQLLGEGSSGLEHANSCALQISRWGFQPRENYCKVLVLAAHEYFHLWNVKRIRPQALGPFDYTQENYTRLLWVSEGFTEYYGAMIVRRAGLMQPADYLQLLAKLIQGYLETPGRRVESVAEASFDAWIKYYRQDEHSVNSSISYYTKGSLIALFMDLEIRHRTGERSLDDLMRLLYHRYYKQLERGFSDLEFREAAEEVAGGSLDRLFDSYAYGTEEMDFGHYLGYAGLSCEHPPANAAPDAQGHLGISVRSVEGRVVVAGVPADSPAYSQGLCVQDEILAVNGFRVSLEMLPARIAEIPPGTKVEILISRAGRMRPLPIVVGMKTPTECRLVQVPHPTPRQQQVYELWLGTPWSSGT